MARIFKRDLRGRFAGGGGKRSSRANQPFNRRERRERSRAVKQHYRSEGAPRGAAASIARTQRHLDLGRAKVVKGPGGSVEVQPVFGIGPEGRTKLAVTNRRSGANVVSLAAHNRKLAAKSKK